MPYYYEPNKNILNEVNKNMCLNIENTFNDGDNNVNIEFFNINDSNKPSIVVIYAKYDNKIVMCHHKNRDTWEIPGGHIEKNETPEMAAKRELYEETGATDCSLIPICKYSFEVKGEKVYAILYQGEIEKIGELPDFEIEEIGFFEKLPDNVTYPKVYEKILEGL